MRTKSSLLSLQEKFNLRSNLSSVRTDSIDYAKFIDDLRDYLNNPQNMPNPEVYSDPKTTRQEKVQMQHEAIETYVKKNPVAVIGYMHHNSMDYLSLMRDAKNLITGAGILQEAFDDDDVEEIQINDPKSIMVIKHGRYMPYCDKVGRLLTFNSAQQIIDLVNRLVDDYTENTVQFVEKSPLYNAKIANLGYRLSAIYPSATAMFDNPLNYCPACVTIRKPNAKGLSMDALIEYGTLTPDMAKLSLLIARTNLNLFFVGETGSGKTTLMKLLLNCVPKDHRIYLIQNPTEITFFERDSNGSLIRNVVHAEASYEADPSNPKTNTMAHLVEQSLRFTPNLIVLGEARTNEEFSQIHRQGTTGQRLCATFHAKGARGAIERFSNAANCSFEDAASVANIIFFQEKFTDENNRTIRRVSVTEMYIDHYTAPDGTEQKKIIYNDLYVYHHGGTINVNGKPKVLGEFVKEGCPSKQLITAFKNANIPLDEYIEFLTEQDQKELREQEQKLLKQYSSFNTHEGNAQTETRESLNTVDIYNDESDDYEESTVLDVDVDKEEYSNFDTSLNSIAMDFKFDI